MRVGSLEIQLMASMARLQKDMNDAQRVVGGAMGNVEKSVAKAKQAMQALGVGLPLVMITDQVRRMTDQYVKLDAQLRLATKSQAQYAQGMADIRRISSIAQADLSATSMLYTRLMNVMDGSGVSQQKLATVTETVAFGLKAYGASAQEASSAALQLSQAMGANRLGGEEFRAVMEAMPNVMKVLAKSMGVPLGELRALSIAGKITADEMVKAFGNPAVAAEFKRLAENAQTITGAWVVARNELMLLIGEFAKSSGGVNVFIGSFNALAETFALLAKHMQSLILIASTYAAFLVTKLVVGTVMAIEKSIAHTEALAMNAAMNLRAAQQEASLAAAKAATASATAASTVSLLRNTMATAEANTATLAKTVADNAATVAQLNHARSVAQLSGHYYIIRQVEAELVVTTQALAVAQTELNASTARQARLQAALIAEDKAALKARGDLVKANAAVVASQNAATASTIGNIAAIGVALRAAAMAHPITAAIVAITAIIAAIANWDAIVKSSKATFTWFMDDFIGGLAFGAKVAGIELAAFVQKIIFVKDNFDKLFSADPNVRMEFARGMKQLTDIAESEKIRAAAVLRGIDDDTRNREALEQAMRQAQDREKWDKLHATKQQQRAIEIAELDAMYVKLAGVRGRSQTEQLALAEEYRVKLSLINEKYSRAERKAAEKEESAKLKAAAKLYEEEIKMRQDYADTLSRETHSIREQTVAVLLETESIGKTKVEIDLLQAARYDHETQVMRETLAVYESATACTIEAEALKEAIVAREAYKKAQITQSEAHAHQQMIDDERRAYEKMWKSIDKTAHDTFVSILDGGKDAATRLKEAFKNSFFDWLYQMTLKKWTINVSGTMAGTGASGMAMAGMGGGGAGLLDIASAGLGMAMSGLTASQALAAASAYGSAALSATTLAEGMSMATAGLSIAMPYIGLATAAVSVISGLFDNGPKGVALGDVSKSFSPTGQVTRAQSFFGGTSAASESIVNSMQTSYMQAAMALGIGTAATQFSYAGNTRGYVGGGGPAFTLSGGAGGKNYSTYQETSEAAVQLAAQRAIFAALQGSQMPAYLRKVFDGLNARSMSAEQINNVMAFATALKQTRDALIETRTPTEVFNQNVADAMLALNTSATTFKVDFVKAIDAGLTEVDFAKWNQLGAAIAQLSSSWQSLTDAIFAEVARIRGVLGTPSGTSAQFATMTAMARAGDENAAKLLPGVAKAMLDVAAMTAGNATDLARIQGRTAASLEVTGMSLAGKYGLSIPAYANGGMHTGGIRLVGENGPELEYTGSSRISSNSDTRNMLDNSGVIDSVNALRAELRAVVSNAQKQTRILDRWDGQGMPEVRTV